MNLTLQKLQAMLQHRTLCCQGSLSDGRQDKKIRYGEAWLVLLSYRLSLGSSRIECMACPVRIEWMAWLG
jgi:hypothetical protein